MPLNLQPISKPEADAFIIKHHSHHKPTIGWKFGIGCNNGEKIVGIICIGRPVSRHLDNGYTAEVTRCCTDRTPHVASKLYAAAWRAAKAMGYQRMITYTLEEELGTSLIAAGWKSLYKSPGCSWSVPSRPRIDKHPLGPKNAWEAPIGKAKRNWKFVPMQSRIPIKSKLPTLF